MECHVEALRDTIGLDRLRRDSYDYYLEAIAQREREQMPIVGPSIDRRVFKHIRLSQSEEAVQALICLCCARVFSSTNGDSVIAYANMEEYFDRINARSFEMNWDFNEYERRYMQHGVLRDHPDLARNAWTWRRRLRCSKYKGHSILCCPEDVHCMQLNRGRHEEADVCKDCFYPICRGCFFKSKNSKEDVVAIPQALTNDNFWGFVTEVIYKYRVRWIESAAACPVFTCLITYYVEGDRGHMMNVEHHRPNRQYAVRGNVYSFFLPWEEIAKKLGSVLEDDGLDVLPHTEQTLASLVLFSLRIGDVVDINKWMPQARLRPHVVL